MIMNTLKTSITAVLAILCIGVIGYMAIEKLSFLDALYLTVVTIYTVGYGDIVPHSSAGRIFTVGLVITGVSMAYYTFSLLISVVVEGRLKDFLGRRGTMKRIDNLSEHIIVCGAGKVGINVIERLIHEGEKFVVIEENNEKYQELLEKKVLAVHGDATLEEILKAAGVVRARGVITALSHDADNVYVTLTAKSLNPGIMIVARADRTEAEGKLLRAGANTVIFPSVMGGRHMVTAMTKPIIMDLIESIFYNPDIHLDMAQIEVAPNSKLVGLSLLDSGIKNQHEAIVVAIKRGETLLGNPRADEQLLAGDIMIVLGQRTALNQIAAWANS